MISFNDKINQIGIQAKEASKILAKVSTKQKNEALLAMAEHVLRDKGLILEANKKDIDQAKAKGLSESFIDRLELDEERINSIGTTLREIESFKDPVGKVLDSWTRPNGLSISRVFLCSCKVWITRTTKPNISFWI